MGWTTTDDLVVGHVVTAAEWNENLGVTGNTQYLYDRLIPSQSDVTASRAIDGTVYQNTGTRPRIVTVGIRAKLANGGAVTLNGFSIWLAKCDAAAAPTVLVGQGGINWSLDGLTNGSQAEEDQMITFIVPVGYYYKIYTSIAGHGATPTLNTWIEYSL